MDLKQKMEAKQKPILFMGTSPFAVGFLQYLVEHNYNVVAVVTAPDKPQGRGRKIVPSPVKEYALQVGLPVLQPTNLKSETFAKQLQEMNPYLGVVVAFRMLPKAIWALPTIGTVNIHGSLLPRWRGAAPINHAIMEGDSKTGVTLFRLQEELDMGDIIGTKEIPITPLDTFGSLHDKLAILGVELFAEKLPLLLDGTASFTQQPFESNTSYATKLTRENTRIDWKWSAQRIYNFVRALAPLPSAWTTLPSTNGTPQPYKIGQCHINMGEANKNAEPGTILLDTKGCLQVVAGDGNIIAIDTLQAPGKKMLPVRDFLNGAKLTSLMFI